MSVFSGSVENCFPDLAAAINLLIYSISEDSGSGFHNFECFSNLDEGIRKIKKIKLF